MMLKKRDDMKQVILKPGKAKPFFKGEPLIFSGAIQNPAVDIKPAELVDVYASDKTPIGMGVFNPNSNYRVRLLAFSSDCLLYTSDAADE